MTLQTLKPGKANLEEFSATLSELAGKNNKILAVTSDSRGSGKLVSYAEKLPEQIVEVGIAEQNLVGVAAGLASTGNSVFAVSPACFLATRSLEQIKNDVAYSNQAVSLIGISAGVSYGALGSTHHSLHDIAALRTIHNMQIVIPADNFETREVIRYAVRSGKPLFVKFGKKNMPHLPRVKQNFELGKASVICEGSDLAFIACGETVAPAYEAARLLEKKGLSSEVVSMHTIAPFDEASVLRLADKCKAIITVEEHSVHGGLGEACAAVLMESGKSLPFKITGIPDEDTVTGSQSEIFDHYGLSAKGLEQSALSLVGK